MTGSQEQSFFWQTAYFQTRQRAYFFSFVALVILIVAGWNTANLYERYLRQEVREEFAVRANSLSSALTQSINRRLALISKLSFFIEKELSQTEELENEMIAQFAIDLYGSTEGIINIAVDPGGVMQCVYPSEENKSILVQETVRDERPNVPPGNQRTTDTGNIILSQPKEIIQGDQGIVARQAIYKDGNYWGITNFSVAILPMLEEAGILSAQNEMVLALKDQAGHIFYGSEDVFASDAVTVTIPLPEGSWELASMPVDGWRGFYQIDLWVYRSLCLILVVTLTMFIYQYTRSDKYLALLVDRRTRDLQESETQYRELANNALVGIYIIQKQVIQFSNQGLADLFGYQSPEEIIGSHRTWSYGQVGINLKGKSEKEKIGKKKTAATDSKVFEPTVV
jgi:sensor domain CHASE-containing protein